MKNNCVDEGDFLLKDFHHTWFLLAEFLKSFCYTYKIQVNCMESPFSYTLYCVKEYFILLHFFCPTRRQ